MRSTVSRIGLGVVVLAVAWVGVRLGTHRHTGILRTVAEFKQYLGGGSGSPEAQQPKPAAPPGPQHSVHLSWNASTSAVEGYNVYRRGPAGLTRINAERVIKTSYVDSTVQPGQTYYYVIKAVNSAGTESVPSNEVPAVVPSP